ncbi:MAG: hypothetical protein QM673_10710 [Gordonia sp. (in: high G+C Gram-positive bacteria)]
MTDDGRSAPDGRPGAQSASGASGRQSGDPVREFILGIATQIDALAALIGGARGTTNANQPGERAYTAPLLDAAGEISSLLGEIGDLLARLLDALIAVLEAAAAALRASPSAGATPRHYQPISVRLAQPYLHDRGPEFEN